jgi:ATP-dependent Lhr-like helicase
VKKIICEPKISGTELASHMPDTVIEKHDSLLPKKIRDIGYGARTFDVDGAYKWILQMENILISVLD